MSYSNINVTIKFFDEKQMKFVDTIALNENKLTHLHIMTDWSFLGNTDLEMRKHNVLDRKGQLEVIIRLKKVEGDYNKIVKQFKIDINDYVVPNTIEPNEPLSLTLSRNFEIQSIPLPEIYNGMYYVDIIINKVINGKRDYENIIQLQSRAILNINK